MNRVTVIVICLFPFFVIQEWCVAQSIPNENNQVEDLLENDTKSDSRNVDDTYLEEKYAFLLDHPLNINTSDYDDFQGISLLDAGETEKIIRHRKTFGNFLCIEELQVCGIAPEKIRILKPFIGVGQDPGRVPFNATGLLKNSTSSLVLRFQEKFPDSKSDETTEEINPYKLWLRYRYKYSDRLQIGLTADKDPGEGFFSGFQKNGFDFYSGFVEWKSRGLIRKIILGDYSVSAGQGLCFWSGLSGTGSSMVAGAMKMERGSSPYSSTDENNYYRGASVTASSGNFSGNIFLSSHAVDANIEKPVDSTYATSLQQSGYHITQNEWDDRKSLNISLGGIHATYRNNNLSLGIVYGYTHFSLPIYPTPSIYNGFEFSGDHNTNLSIHYFHTKGNLTTFGEIARSQNSGTAWIEGCMIHLNPSWSSSIVVRNFQKNFHSINGTGWSQGTHVANEQGIFVCHNISLSRSWGLDVFADLYSFPWLKYKADLPSTGSALFLQLTWKQGKSTTMYFRVIRKFSQENIPDDANQLDRLSDQESMNYRINYRIKIGENWEWGGRMQWSSDNVDGSSSGTYLSQDIFYRPVSGPFRFSVRIATFHCKTFSSRIYAYENDVLYSYSIPFFYGKGARMYINTSCRLGKKMEAWIKLARTVYFEPASTENSLTFQFRIRI